MAIPASASVCAASESAAVGVRACPRDSPAIRTIIANVCGSRARELTPERSRLSIIVEGGNTCQQCRTIGIPESEPCTISTLLAANSANVFARRVVGAQAFCRGHSLPLVFKRIGNYVCTFFPLLFFPPRARARSRADPSALLATVPLAAL